MKNFIFLLVIFLISTTVHGQFFPTADSNKSIPNNIDFLKHDQKIITGSTVNPKSTAISAGAGSILLKTDGSVFLKKDSGSSTNWNKFLDDTFSVTGALGYTPENAANKGAASGYASLDASGLVPITKIPPAALERLVVVADQTARYALTIATVQNGDTVKQADTGEMFFVKDETNLGNANGYAVYTAGTASSVAWSGITGVPTASSSANGILTSSDWSTFNGKQSALGFTPENVSNKATSTTLGTSDTLYPSQNAVKTYVDNVKLDDLKDVVTATAVANQHLAFDGSNWVPADLVTSAGAVLTPTYVDNGNGNITVNQVTANLFNNDTFIAPAKTYTLAPITATLTDLTTSYIVGDYNSGTPIIKVITDVNLINESNVVPLLTIFRSGTYLHVLDWDSLGKGLSNKTHQSIVKTQRYRRESGLAITATGTRNIDVSAGIVWVGANKVTIAKVESVFDNIFYFQRTGASAWNTVLVTQFNNTQYWDGATNATLGGGKYAVNWLYRGVEQQKHLYMVIGEGDYSLAQAQASQPPSNLPSNITSHAVLVGRIIVVKNSNTPTQVDSAFSITFTQSAASNHNDLSGLQGGAASEYFHATSNQNSVLNDLSIASNTITASESLAVAQTFKAGAEYFQGTSKVDGSFGKDTSSWSASVGTIVRTANTEMQGNYVGVWSGTGTGTLDLLWTATASNTYELSAQIKLDVPSDYTLCGVVNGTETGCKVLSGYVANKIYKASVFADSILGTSFYLRLKHTGSGAFSATVDDGKIEPNTLNIANLTQYEGVGFSGFTSRDSGTNAIKFKTQIFNTAKDILTVDTASYNKYTFKKVAQFQATAGLETTAYVTPNAQIIWFNAAGVAKQSSNLIGNAANTAISNYALNGTSEIGDYLIFTINSGTTQDGIKTFFNVNAQSTSDNVIVTSQDGMATTATLSYAKVNDLAGNQGLGAFTAGYVSYVKVGDSLHYSGSLTLGTTTSSEARIPLPNGYTVSQKSVPALRIAGKLSKNDSAVSYFGSSVLIEGGNNFFQIGYQGSTVNELTKSPGNNYASGSVISFDATIPIAGWSSGPTVYSYNSRMEVFSANVAAAGTITNATQNFVTSCTNAAPSVCSLWSGFGVTPICWAHTTDITKRAEVSSNTATTATVARTDTGTAFNLFCHLK